MSMSPIPPAVDTGFGGEPLPPRSNPLITGKRWRGPNNTVVTTYNVVEKIRDCGWFVEYMDKDMTINEMPMDEFMDTHTIMGAW